MTHLKNSMKNKSTPKAKQGRWVAIERSTGKDKIVVSADRLRDVKKAGDASGKKNLVYRKIGDSDKILNF